LNERDGSDRVREQEAHFFSVERDHARPSGGSFFTPNKETIAMSLRFELKELATTARSGDAQAMERFAHLALLHVQQIARKRLHGNRLTRWIDEGDIAQEVVSKAWRRVKASNLECEVQYWDAMLHQMTTYAIVNEARKVRHDLKASRSEPRASDPRVTIETLEDRSTRSGVRADIDELLASIQLHIPSRFLPIWQLRRKGHTWNEIGLQVGSNPHALRVRFNKMLRNVVTTHKLAD